MGPMDGKVAIVTGGGSGMGRATCELLAERGARVIIADIDETDGASTAAAIGAKAVFCRLDVGEESEWIDAVAEAEQLGGLSIVVNCAGVSSPKPIVDAETEDWTRVFRVNGLGTFYGCKHGVRAMRERGGAIVNISSNSAVIGMANRPIYSASKAAVNALTRSVATYCREQGLAVRCNSVLPGGTRTKLVRQEFLRRGVDIDDGSPQAEAAMADFADPRLLANAIVFLASDEAARVNGAELIVDGMGPGRSLTF
jgi:3(or 17)beta-hydroxysteroid dehydrogenase